MLQKITAKILGGGNLACQKLEGEALWFETLNGQANLKSSRGGSALGGACSGYGCYGMVVLSPLYVFIELLGAMEGRESHP